MDCQAGKLLRTTKYAADLDAALEQQFAIIASVAAKLASEAAA